MKKLFLLSTLWLFLVGCKKDEPKPKIQPKPTPENRIVEFYYEFGGKKGKCYSLGLYLFDMNDVNKTNPLYSSPLVTGSLDKDYTQQEPLRVWVPYPGLKLAGDYYLWVETYGGNSLDSLKFLIGSGGSSERVPFRPHTSGDSISYYRSLGGTLLL